MDNQQNSRRFTSNLITGKDAVTRYILWVLLAFLLVFSFLFIKQTFDKAALESNPLTSKQANAKPVAMIATDVAAVRVENIVLNKPVLVSDYAFASHIPKPMAQQSNRLNQASETNNNKITTEKQMKVQEHTIPGSGVIKPKMTEFLPDELKDVIKASMLTDEQISALSEEERKAYKRTQREIVDTLRELAGVEEENQRLKGDLGSKMQTNQSLNKEINELRKQFQ